MARPPKGKPLTFRPMRLDDDVFAECQRLGKVHGTINEGMAAAHAALRMQEAQGREEAGTQPTFRNTKEAMLYAQRNKIPTVIPTTARPAKPPLLKPSEKKGKKLRG